MFCSPRDPPAPPSAPPPPVMGVARRNERERKRVRLVNMGFARLRQFVPGHRPGKRLSKVETLRAAIHYIRHLRQILGEADKPWDAPLHQRSFPPLRRGPYEEEEMGPYGQAPFVCEGAPWGPFVWTPVEAPCQYEDRVEVQHPAYVPEYLY